MPTNQDPYAPPAAELIKQDGDIALAVAIREKHISHDASVKSIGMLYFMGAAVMLILSMGMMFALFQPEMAMDGSLIGLFIFYIIFGVAAIFLGRGLRTLRRWVKVPVGFISAIGLLGFPVGTLINGFVLYLIFSSKGKMVLSDEYQEIVRKTPDIKYQTSIIVWISLFILLALIALAIVVPPNQPVN